MAAAVARFICLEVAHMARAFPGCWFLTAGRQAALVAVMRIEMVVYVAAKISRAMEPGTGTDKDAVHKPFRAYAAPGLRCCRV